MTFNNNSYDEQARIIAIMIGPIADATYFTMKKASLNIDKIFYMAS